ncbi:MAG: hypothetical protein R2849_05745 [Thermomicrobiales bacterium]
MTGQQGVLTTIEATVAPGDSAVIDVLEEIGTEGWVGYAEVVADEPVGAYVLRSKPTANMAITNMAMSGNPEPGLIDI